MPKPDAPKDVIRPTKTGSAHGGRALAHLEQVIGPVPSTPTVWRSLDEADSLQVARIHQAVCRFRAPVVGELAARPEGFSWLEVAGRELTGTTVIDLDASVVKESSDQKEITRPTYQGGVGSSRAW
jgi:hypothetical protein